MLSWETHTQSCLLSAVNNTSILAELMKKCREAQQLMNTDVTSHNFNTTLISLPHRAGGEMYLIKHHYDQENVIDRLWY